MVAVPVRRVLVVSADMGEGHNATGRALVERVHQLWPDAEVRWVDTLDRMGGLVGPAFRWTYVTNVESTPWLYEFFYGSLWRMRWFATASKRFVAEWAGRGLRPVVREFRPELVLSTYPLGSAGLEWLRARGELPAPTAAWISDFAPHPFWVYGGLDRNVVMHEVAVAPARTCVPSATVSVSAPPVASKFVPGDKARARVSIGLDQEAFVAMVSCGSLGFGSVPDAVRELLAADERVTVLVICGRNETLRAEVAAIAPDDPRLIPYGWTDDIPLLLAASDVLVTNAGGATSLEAMACEVPVLMYQPIAAHGRANAELMAESGLAVLCRERGSLTPAVRALLDDPARLKAMSDRAREHNQTANSLETELTVLAGQEPAPQQVRPQDSLFLYAESEQYPQQLGAVLILQPKSDGSPARREDAEAFFDVLPGTSKRMRRRGILRHPLLADNGDEDGYLRVSEVDISEQVTARREDAALDEALSEFFSAKLDPYQYAGRARMVYGLENGRSAFLVSAHHAFVDGMAVTGALIARGRNRPWPVEPGPYDEPENVGLREIARGLVSLARGGAVRRSPLNRTVGTRRRCYRRAWLAQAPLETIANALEVTVPDVLLGLLGEALYREIPETRRGVRLTVPQSTRTVRTFRSSGNHTGAVRLDVPMGDLSAAERIRRTAAALRAGSESGAPLAARMVVRAMGWLPAPLHRVLAANFNSGAWFSMVASILPGSRAPVGINDSPVTSVYPILPLARNTAFAAGFMLWHKEVTLCVTSDPSGVDDAERLCRRVERVCAELVEELGS